MPCPSEPEHIQIRPWRLERPFLLWSLGTLSHFLSCAAKRACPPVVLGVHVGFGGKACKLTTDLGSGPPGHRYVPTAVCSAVIYLDRPPRLPVHLSCFSSSFEVHLGVSRTISLLRRRFWRDMLEKDISMLRHVPPMPEANVALDERQPQISIKGWTRPVISWGWSWTLRR